MSRHLAIDAVGAKHGGAATVVCEVVRAALSHREVGRVTLFASPASLRRFDLPQDARLTVVDQAAVDRSAALRVAWHLAGLTAATAAAGADALLCLSGGGAPPAGITSATFIQQALPFSAEARARFGVGARVRFAALRTTMAHSTAACHHTVVQTPTMKRWLCDAFKLTPERVIVAEPGAPELPVEPPSPTLATMRSTHGARLLYVGNDSPYKNLGILPGGLVELRRRGVSATLFATLPATHPLLRMSGVVALGYLSAGALREAYGLADALVLPSLVETVGLPLLEAMSRGTPVVVADRPYARDVCADAATRFNPNSPDSLAAALELVLGDARLRDRMIAAGKSLAAERQQAHPYGQLVDAALR